MWRRGCCRLLQLGGSSHHPQPAAAEASHWPPPSWGSSRGIAERVNGVAATVQFERFYEAPTMSADAVLATLRELVQEQSADVHLLAALSRRFAGHAEEFFPPQIEELMGAFAQLGYCDEHLVHGVAGRMEDLASDASPRRVVRLLRYASTLHLRPDAWLGHALAALHRQMPNMREGLPAVIISLHGLRWRDDELEELLLTQGFIVSEHLGDEFLGRLLEAWTRYGQWDEEVQDRLETLAEQFVAQRGQSKSKARTPDLRDGLNILAGLRRCSAAEERRSGPAADHLEKLLVAQVQSAGPEEVSAALGWMKRLALRSDPLWKASADSVELALKEKAFVRDLLPEATHCLASLAGSGKEEAALVAGLLSTAEVKAATPKYGARQSLQLLHAVSMLRLRDESVVGPLAAQTARLARQLTLPERRILLTVSDASGSPDDSLAAASRNLSLLPLPPLLGNEPALAKASQLSTVRVGAESLLIDKKARRIKDESALSGVKYLGFGDMLTEAGQARAQLSPACRLAISALERHGWKVELRP
eukprot:TRINITY_DN87979_c0_g1_i1.p1 TRINITY_DN87979_c0_g1~~TRINITY_DN87979_c0_g1_i1.p1  ORF type:complete len:535 (+),score=108.75 TRINITY_DN87979_c0_g1_i1:16-1620(+)